MSGWELEAREGPAVLLVVPLLGVSVFALVAIVRCGDLGLGRKPVDGALWGFCG
ncbi:MAG: hypothetical protein IBJ08_13815, partial [Pseudomonas sp.]|nr:hypothetical protein [Pseudomonas sp.]